MDESECAVTKPDFPPLLSAGIHHMTMREIRARFVLPFPNDLSRPRLYNNLTRWVEELRAARIGATLWVNGSFVTAKPNPADLDCVLWNPVFWMILERLTNCCV